MPVPAPITRRLRRVVLPLLLLFTALSTDPAPAADPISSPATTSLDDIWSLATLHKDPSSPFFQEIKLRGRYHGQAHWLDSSVGDSQDWEDRRSRLGLDVRFLDSFLIRADAQSSDGFDPLYKGIVDLYLKWSPADSFSLTVGKQQPLFARYDWLLPSTLMATFERSHIFNQFRIDRLPGLTIDGKRDHWIYRVGIYSNQVDNEFGSFDGGALISAGIGYDLSQALPFTTAQFHLDYVHSNITESSTLFDRFEHLVSSTLWLADNRWRLVAELFTGTGESPSVGGGYLLHTYDLLQDRLQLVTRLSYSQGDGPTSLSAQPRYERRATAPSPAPTGDQYHALYFGLQIFLHGEKLKLMTGVEHSRLSGTASGDPTSSWIYMAGIRLFF
jgi:phosphate-selective porin OprO and OprP